MSDGKPNGSLIGFLYVLGIVICTISALIIYYSSQTGMIKRARGNTYRPVELYLNYLKRYPSGKYADEANESILNITRNMSDRNTLYVVNTICRYARNSDDAGLTDLAKELSYIAAKHIRDDAPISSWEELRRALPTAYKLIAQEKIDSIKTALEEEKARIEAEKARKEAEEWGTEYVAWNTSSTSNTIEAYKKYLNLYPNGAHSSQAKMKIIDLEVEKDFSAQHSTLPPMDKVGYGNGSYSTVRVKNDTDYELTLLYSGASSKELVIRPHLSGSVILRNGRYNISARVTGAYVKSYVGTETLNGGDYEVSYYIVTRRY